MNDKFSLLKKMRRLSGILVHPTSLPGKFGVGDLGPEAYRFVDFLQEAGQHLWQTLPLGPTGGHNSPYQCFSSFAGQPLLISPELLLQEGLLAESDLSNVPAFPEEEVDFKAVQAYKEELFKKAFTRFKGLHWLEWEKKYRKPTKSQKAVIERDLEDEILYEKFLQWTFFHQWSQLKAYANERDILLIGDIPIFVSGDSSDVWAEPRLFQVDSDGFPTVVAGVPPDYFSATGQLWGNPLYDWKYHKKTNYTWWMDRFKTQFLLSDIVRIDHFRGLESYWEIPADSETALNGKWVDGPKDDFFETLIQSFGEEPPIIAEDLGIITDEVRALRDKFGLPGMKILQFAFEDDDSNYLPYNQPYNCVCYTGTHDNDTTTGWYASASEKARDKVRRYMNTDGSQISWDFIRTCFGTPARFALIPIQDLFCQGSEYRMNTPGKAEGNWAYRVKKELLTSDVAKRLYDVTKLYGR